MNPRPKVLITGGTRRIGGAIAMALAQAGYDLILHARTIDATAKALAHDLSASGANIALEACDLAEAGEVQAMAARVARDHDVLAGLINAAALFAPDDIATIDQAGFARHQQVNVLSPLLLIQSLIPALEAGDGAIINLLDHDILFPNIDVLSYKLSKFAMAGATRILARRLAPKIRVNGLAPGLTLPSPLQDQPAFEAIHDRVPLRRGSRVEDVAAAAFYLLSARAITGEILFVDGGERFLARERDISLDPPTRT